MRLDPRLTAALAPVWLAGVFLFAVPARAEPFRLVKQFDLAPADRFELRSEIGSVTLEGVDGRRASVVITSDEDLGRHYDLRFDHSGGRLEVAIERRQRGPFGWFGWFRQHRTHTRITIELPRATPVDLHTSGGAIDLSSLEASVKARSSGGAVRIAEVTGDVTLSSSGGGVEARGVRGALRLDSSGGGVTALNVEGPVSANTSGGSLTLDSVRGDVSASSSGGGVRISGAFGYVRAGSSGGPVRVSFAAGNGRGGDISSSGGGVSVAVDPAARLDVDAQASGGSVRCELPVTVRGTVGRDKLHGKLNGGGALLKLRSSGGGISIDGR